MSTHTPGPWIAGRDDMATIVDGVDSKWIYAGDKYIAVASGVDIKDWDEVMANARLIAAAPELLAALKQLLLDPMAERTVDAAKRAIGKAEGRS